MAPPTGHFPPINTSCHSFSSSTPQSTGTGNPTPPRKRSILIVRGSEQSTPLQQQQAIDHLQNRSNSVYVMSRGSKGGRGLDLKLHLSPPAPSSSSSSDEEWSSSSPSSCLSSEGELERVQREPQQSQSHNGLLQWSDSPDATSMVLAACPRCLMYVMLSEADPRCPRCRSPVLLDFLHRAACNRNSSINVSGGGREGDGHGRSNGGGRNSRRA